MKALIILLSFCGIVSQCNVQFDLSINNSPLASLCNITNDSLYIFARIDNLGVTVVGNTRVGYYLTNDQITDPISDFFIGSTTIGTLPGGANTTVQFSILLGSIAGVPNGTYYVGIYADDNFMKPEPNENNNDLTWSNCITTFPITVNVGELNNQINVTIYPNPSSTQIIIEYLNKSYNLTIYNSFGQELHVETNILEATKRVDVSKFNRGLLFIRIESDGEVYNHKLLKQ
jgi:hypothetical protein